LGIYNRIGNPHYLASTSGRCRRAEYFQKVKPINLNVFRKMAFYARGADVSLMGIIHYEIAKFQGKSTFTLPYPVLAEAQFDDAVFHKILGTFKAVPDERRNYEKWITQTEAYIVSDGKRPILSRETEDIPCGIDGASYNSSLYSATFNW
jgi:hypothetical protein